MRVLDFDNTIYDGESVLDFYLFSIKYNPRVLKYLFPVVYHFLRYRAGKTTVSDLKIAGRKYAESYARSFSDIDSVVRAFWDSHIQNIKPWYTPQEDDVILTASFNIIMEEACRRIGVKNCICSVLNRKTFKVEYINFNQNKCETFNERFGKETEIDSFYTDNLADMPMIERAKRAYLVCKNDIKRVK